MMEIEREEGEITDEDLENISDSDISLLLEDLSTTDSSDELSLVTVSKGNSHENISKLPLDTKKRKIDDDYSTKPVKYTRHHHDSHKSRHRKFSDGSDDSSSDSDDYISDRRILKQLKDAVRINSSRKNPNCSLRSRIKRMIEPESQPPSPNTNISEEDDIQNLRDQALKSKTVTPNSVKNHDICENGENDNNSVNGDCEPVKNGENSRKNLNGDFEKSEKGEKDVDSGNHTKITDEDLISLRLVALQSAVLKKHKERIEKRKEQKTRSKEQDTELHEIEKAPDILDEIFRDELEIENIDVDTKSNDSLELKTEKSDNIVPENKAQNTEIVQTTPKIEDTEEKPSEKNIFDEDEDILRAMLLTSISRKIASKKNGIQSDKVVKLPKIVHKSTTIKPLPSSKPNVIKPKSPIKRIIINVNSDSESDTNNEASSPEKKKQLPKKEIINFEQDLSKLLKEARKKSEVQKSQQAIPQSDVSRHLPKSQQIEYRKLKRKLQILSHQNLLLKHKRGNNVDENKPQINNKSNVLDNKPTSIIKKQFSSKLNRLQMKGKYESLVPLMSKIAKAREARDTAQNDVTRLINELKEARTRLTTTHKLYSTLVKQLQQIKTGIDQRGNVLPSRESKANKPLNTISNVCTSTPLKENNKENVCDISSILDEKTTIMDEPKKEKEIMNNETIFDETTLKLKPEIETTDLQQDKETSIKDKPIFFPDVKEDDGDKKDKLSEDIIKYNSPLEHIQTSEEYGGNPLTVLCPYDLLGVCRDPDCAYRH